MKCVTYASVHVLFNGDGRFDSKIGFPSKYPKLTDTNIGLLP